MAAKAAAGWRDLCAVLSRCGLEQLATDAVRVQLLHHAIVPELHGPALGLGAFSKEAVPAWREATAAPAPQEPEAGIWMHSGIALVPVVTHAHQVATRMLRELPSDTRTDRERVRTAVEKALATATMRHKGVVRLCWVLISSSSHSG